MVFTKVECPSVALGPRPTCGRAPKRSSSAPGRQNSFILHCFMFLAFIRYFSLKLVSSDIFPPFLCDALEFWMIKVDVLVFFKDLGVWIETYNLFCYIYGEKINCILDTNYDQRRVRNGNFIFKKTSTTYFGFVFFFFVKFQII